MNYAYALSWNNAFFHLFKKSSNVEEGNKNQRNGCSTLLGSEADQNFSSHSNCAMYFVAWIHFQR